MRQNSERLERQGYQENFEEVSVWELGD